VLEGRDRPWLDAVAPGLHTVGAMVPYSGLHHLLFDRLDGPLVMTSANLPGQPMATTADELRAMDAPDAALVHDRAVVNRCDDSVVRVVDGRRQFLRRSRGWVPERLPLPVDVDDPILAVGGGSDVTVAVADGDLVVPSQHVGDVDGPATERFHRDATGHLTDLLDVEPTVAAHDRHPDFQTTAIAAEYDRQVPVQHHHAHAASLLAERDRKRAIVVAADGTGYDDGVVRGGEVLDSTLADSERVGGLGRFRLPGGEAAVREPARTLAALLDDRERAVSVLVDRGVASTDEAAATVWQQAAAGVNSPPTTSAGRFLDAVAALCGCCSARSYQGEPAMRLEALARGGSPLDVDPPLAKRDGGHVFAPDCALQRLDGLLGDHPVPDVAATAQAMLGEGLGRIAVRAARERGRDAVGFTGGVAYNPAITASLRRVVADAGLALLRHDEVPPGDGGLAYGQAVTAAARLVDR
jgi:hydrogenase maturation protein HypF